MKILLINYRYFMSGGPERYLFNIKGLLERNGHQVIPYSIKSKNNAATEYEKFFADPMGGQDSVYFKTSQKTYNFAFDVIARLFYSFEVKNSLKRLIKETKPDVAYILHHYNKLSPSVIDACKESAVPVIIRLSDYFLMCPQAHFIDGSKKTCEKCLTGSLFHCVINKCVMNSYAGSLLKSLALHSHRKILKIYDKVDSFVCTTDFMKAKLRVALFDLDKLSVVNTFADVFNSGVIDFNHDNKLILYAGRMSPEKGVDILLKAYIQSRLYDKGVQLHIAGGLFSDLSPECFTDEQRMLIEDKVTFHGFANDDELDSLMSRCTFTVVPSRWYENLPNSVIESYMYGKPVIATRIGSLPECVIDNYTGLLFESGNVTDLAEKLALLSFDQCMLDSFKSNILKERSKYDPDLHYRKLMAVFESCLQER